MEEKENTCDQSFSIHSNLLLDLSSNSNNIGKE